MPTGGKSYNPKSSKPKPPTARARGGSGGPKGDVNYQGGTNRGRSAVGSGKWVDKSGRTVGTSRQEDSRFTPVKPVSKSKSVRPK